MSVLKSIKTESTSVQFKLPGEVAEKLKDVRKKARQKGFSIDVDGAVTNALKHLLTKAEKELGRMAGVPADTE